MRRLRERRHAVAVMGRLIDFDTALPVLGLPELTWLQAAIERRDPGHGWLERLRQS